MNQRRGDGSVVGMAEDYGCGLVHMSDPVTAEAVASVMKTSWAGRNIFYEEEQTSTNETAKRLAEEGAPQGTLVVAEYQTAGKGRRGREWHSPKGSGIWMSMVLRPAIRPDKAAMLTIVAAMAVFDAISSRVSNCAIKWPNDIVADGKKICGILTEMSAEFDTVHYVIVGIGINVNTKDFPEDIGQVAASLYTASGSFFKRREIIADIWQAFERYETLFMKHKDLSEIMTAYNARLINCGRKVYIEERSGRYEALALGIDAEGCLCVQKEDGTQVSVMSGEVSVRGVLGYV